MILMHRRLPIWPLITVLLLVLSMASPADAADESVDVAFTKFVLDNGLTVIVHEDHKAPIVAVNVWYHVGSKNEKPGKTGFAHLFEHLMFNGSEHYNDDYSKPFERVGATGMNGTTNSDRTNYFENVPTTALDLALWLESDRMGHLLGVISQEKLDQERGVVQNEKRQNENQPYGRVFNLIAENCYPEGHPYSWPVIGYMDDLGAASLDDVHEWFQTYYGAANAVISIAGDIDIQTARQKVEQFFGDIPSGPPIDHQRTWPAKRTGTHRQTMQDRVPQARIYKVWNIPQWGAAEADHLDLFSDLLALGKTSRLYKRLVYDTQIATEVSASVFLRELGGLFIVDATARPGQDLGEVERAVDEELSRLLADGPTERELHRVKTQYRARLVRGLESIGGMGGKSDILASGQVYMGRPDFYKVQLARAQAVSAEQLRDTARRWLSDGVYVLEVHPFADYKTAEIGADRSKLPEPESFPDVRFPQLQRATLGNGLKIVLAGRSAVPIVEIQLLFNAGYAADQFGQPGTASLALDMLDEGTGTRSALQISEELDLLGASMGTGSNLDMSSVSLSSLAENLDASLEIFADVVLNPAFPERDFQRLKQQQLARIAREQVTPIPMALRVFPKLLYGEGHAYGLPFTGSGTAASVAAITRDDLAKFHAAWFKPNNATLVVVGDVTLKEITAKLEQLFQDWQPGGVPVKNLEEVGQQPKSVVYLMDRPGSLQSIIFAGHVAPPKANPDETAIEAVNEVLGGSFMARMNRNLRVEKRWSYGAQSIIVDARGQRPFLAVAAVQTDKTMESMREIQKELEGIHGDRPATSEELARAISQSTLTLPGKWETSGAVLGSIAEMVRFGLPDDYWDTYAANVRRLRLPQVNSVAKDLVHPGNVVWVVVGDRAKIADAVAQLGLGDIHLIAPDGTVLGRTTP